MNASREAFTKLNLEKMLEVFPCIDLESIVDDAVDLGYTTLATAFFHAAAEAEARGDEVQNKILSLLYEVCQTRLRVDLPQNPFDDSFTESEVEFFATIVRQINNLFIKARLADRVWNSRKHRSIEYALLAIDSYTNIPLDSDTWYVGGEACWRRAVSLSLLVGDGAGNRLEKIESKVLNSLLDSTVQTGFYGHSLANLLMTNDLAHESQIVIAEKLESLASEFDAIENFRTSGRYYNASHKWFSLADSEGRAVDMKVAEATAFEKEAMSRIESDDPSHMVAVGFLKNAVQTYSEIPRTLRERHSVDQKIRELTLRIGEFGKLSLDEMARYTTPEVDVSEIVERSRQYVSGKPIFEALALFANLHHTDFDELRDLALKNLVDFPFRNLFPNRFIGHDGRVTGTTPGFGGTGPSADDEEIIRAEMNHFYFGTSVSLAVYASILPALRVLNLEHCFNEGDLADLARRSPIVPRGRESLWGKALFQGFNYDFATSIHILVPQIEHLVRLHLKVAGAVTTFINYSAGGRETENGLSALMKLPETETVFGKNLSYEISALFCEFTGPNLRNDVAHGLLDDQQISSVYSVYAWWFGLKLVVRSLLQFLDSDSPEQQE